MQTECGSTYSFINRAHSLIVLWAVQRVCRMSWTELSYVVILYSTMCFVQLCKVIGSIIVSMPKVHVFHNNNLEFRRFSEGSCVRRENVCSYRRAAVTWCYGSGCYPSPRQSPRSATQCWTSPSSSRALRDTTRTHASGTPASAAAQT